MDIKYLPLMGYQSYWGEDQYTYDSYCLYPFQPVVVSGGSNLLDRSYDLKDLRNPAGGFDGNKNCSHDKAHVKIRSIPENHYTGETWTGMHLVKDHTVVLSQPYDEDIFRYHYWELYKKLDSKWVPTGKFLHGHLVWKKWNTQGDSHAWITYNARFGDNYGQIHPTWTVYFINPGLTGVRVYRCTPNNQGYNPSSCNETSLMLEPKFTKAQLQQIEVTREKFYSEFDSYNCSFTNSIRTEWPENVVYHNFLPHPDLITSYTPDWGKLAAQAYDTVPMFTGNGLALLKDIKEFKESSDTFLKNVRHLPDKRLQSAANIYLAIHYGYRLMAADLKELAQALVKSSRKLNHAKCMASESSGSGESTLNVYYNVYGLLSNDIMKLCDIMDLSPSFRSTWDFIPFSFIVDWFVNIGDLAEGISAFYDVTQKHGIRGSVTTKKVHKNFVYGVDNLSYYVEQTSFQRRCSAGWAPIPSFHLEASLPDTNHFIEAGALIVSRK